jgi:hypothetical protein
MKIWPEGVHSSGGFGRSALEFHVEVEDHALTGCPRGDKRGSAAAGLLVLRVRIPPGTLICQL